MPPRSTDLIRFGLIGAGHIAQRFVEGLRHVPDARLTHVWSRTAAATEAYARQHGAVPLAALDALLVADIDAIYIATLHDSHASYSMAAMNAGKAVLCEKPAALNLPQLEAVLATAARTRCLFMEAMKPPFYPLYQQLRAQLADDPIGPIRLVRAGFSHRAPANHPVLQAGPAAGALLDIGIYPAFLAVDWLGQADHVQGMGRLRQDGVDLMASMQCRHGDAIAQLYCGIDSCGLGDAMLVGERGSVHLAEKWWNPGMATIAYADGRKVILELPFTGNGLNYETAHFCQLLRQGRTESDIVSHEHSRQMISLLDRARLALRDA